MAASLSEAKSHSPPGGLGGGGHSATPYGGTIPLFNCGWKMGQRPVHRHLDLPSTFAVRRRNAPDSLGIVEH